MSRYLNNRLSSWGPPCKKHLRRLKSSAPGGVNSALPILMPLYPHILTVPLDWANVGVHAALLTAAYVPDPVNHKAWTDVSANETSGTNYQAGGQPLVNKAITYDPTTQSVALNANNLVWPLAAFSCRYLVLYLDTGPLVGYVDLGPQTSQSQDFHIQFSPLGVLTKKVI